MNSKAPLSRGIIRGWVFEGIHSLCEELKRIGLWQSEIVLPDEVFVVNGRLRDPSIKQSSLYAALVQFHLRLAGMNRPARFLIPGSIVGHE
jgi:hypothetical protein